MWRRLPLWIRAILERAYGPVIAIATSSVIFTLIHLTHGKAILPFLPFYLVVAVVYALMVFFTGSILPSMTLHFAGDVVMLTMQYLRAREGVMGGAPTGTISLPPAIAFLALAALSVLAFRLLVREKRGVAPAGSMPGILRPTST